MTLHLRFEYTICVANFVPGHWLFFATCLLTPKNKWQLQGSPTSS